MRRLALLCLAFAITCKVRVPSGTSAEGDFPCETSDTCPVPDSACLLSTCLEGSCVFVPAPNGVLPAEEQVQGDCKQLFCDGDGETIAYASQLDLPQDDGNPCTEAVCDLDIPKQVSKIGGTRCPLPSGEEGLCNGDGSCGICMPKDVRCDGHATATCSSDGQWGEPAACTAAAPVCRNGACAGVAEIDSGADHTCARFADGSVRCWGNNSRGQLGTTGLSGAWAAPWASGFAAVRVSHRHRCGIRRDRTVWCWGYGELGQLGNGSRAPSSGPVATGVKALALDSGALDLGADHGCAVVSGGRVTCWGRNDQGQLGSGVAPASPLTSPVPATGRIRHAAPQLIAGLEQATSLHLDGLRTCALQQSGGMRCWGLRFEAMPIVMPAPVPAGDKPPEIPKDVLAASRDKPAPVTGLTDATAVSCGGHHCCALRKSGSVSCWGSGKQGALGTGNQNDSFVAVAVNGVNDARSIGVGQRHACALRSDGSVLCWGANDRGQLGTGLAKPFDVAKVIATLGKVRHLSVADEHVCVLLESGGVSCWGDNRAGQLGRGAATGGGAAAPLSRTPELVVWP